MILVIGATGTNGREVLDRLVAGGHDARALVRDPDKAAATLGDRVELVRGDLDDPGSIAAALDGVDHAFYVAAVDRRGPAWFDNFLGAAVASPGRPHVVKFSALGADPASPVELIREHGEADRKLAGSGLGWTILRPNSFYQNLLWSAGSIKKEGAIYQPLGDARQSQVDVRDIAEVAVAALTKPGHEGETYDITGPEALSYDEIARTLADAIGKPVRYVNVPPDAVRRGMLDSGMPAWQADAVTELMGYFADGKAATVSDAVERVTGRPPIPLARFAADFADAFR